MICEVCKKNHADIVFKTVTDGQVATRAMCLSCAHRVQQDIMRMFMNLGASEQAPQVELPAPPAAEAPRYICTGCGRPFTTLDEHSMAGCPRCYDAMETELASHFHMRQTPARPDLAQGTLEDDSARELRFKLMEAVIHEDYELAALLRSQIAQAGSGAEDKA